MVEIGRKIDFASSCLDLFRCQCGVAIQSKTCKSNATRRSRKKACNAESGDQVLVLLNVETSEHTLYHLWKMQLEYITAERLNVQRLCPSGGDMRDSIPESRVRRIEKSLGARSVQ